MGVNRVQEDGRIGRMKRCRDVGTGVSLFCCETDYYYTRISVSVLGGLRTHFNGALITVRLP